MQGLQHILSSQISINSIITYVGKYLVTRLDYQQRTLCEKGHGTQQGNHKKISAMNTVYWST